METRSDPAVCRGTERGRLPLAAVILAAALALPAGCADYRIGNRSLFPVDIQTVHVPVFESASFRRGLGEWLTEAVVKEIELRTPYKVVGDPNADTVLVGRIVNDRKHLLFQARSGYPRELEESLQVQVSWLDRRGNTIRQGPPIPVPAECVTVTRTSDVVPEVGQSIATGQQEAIKRLARQIVSLMEAPW